MTAGASGDTPASIGIIGTGWRAGFFLRVAAEPGTPLEVRRMLAHSSTSARNAASRWRIPVDSSLDAFLAHRYDFVVVAVPRDDAAGLTEALVARGVPVLLETPPAPDLAALRTLYARLGAAAPVQVAEQYPFQPHHAARIAVARSGALGPISSAAVSAAHEYHGVRLIRSLLGVGFVPMTITAQRFPDPVVRSLSADGWASDMRVVRANRVIAQLRFDDGTVGLYDFEDEQYFSPIRSRHVHVRGERGELVDDRVRILPAPGSPVAMALERRQAGIDGDLEGAFLDRITLGTDVVYQNPFPGARLTDDEIAIATVCARMHSFVRDGRPFSPLADACHDAAVAHHIAEAARTGAAVVTPREPWSDDRSMVA